MRRFHAALIVALLPAPVFAQSDFSGLKVAPGDVIYVTNSAGTVVSGPLTTISPSALTIDSHEFKPAPGLKIERRGDSLKNGTLIGLAVGAGLAAMVASLGDCVAVECTKGASLLAPVAVYGAIGAFIDWRRKGRTLIYDGGVAQPSVRIAPEVTPTRKALSVTVSF
jgi:hypothetical protein